MVFYNHFYIVIIVTQDVAPDQKEWRRRTRPTPTR